MRLILVLNPRSSQYAAVTEEILEPARKLKGWTVGKFELDLGDVDENARRLAEILREGDLVVAAGGDGTASVAVNGAMKAQGGVTLGVLGYGNFNDTARMLGVRRKDGLEEIIAQFAQGGVEEIYPLEALVNGQHWRYAAAYVTVGMLAASTAVFETESVRWKLRSGKPRLCFSLWSLVKWYFRNRHQEWMPAGYYYNERWPAATTDYMAVNGKTVAQVMRGGEWYRDPQEFQSNVMQLGSFWRMVGMMLRSIFKQVPGKITRGDKLEFVEPSEVVIQAEGEHERLMGVEKIEVRKAGRGLRVVMGAKN